MELGLLDEELGEAIERAAQEVIDALRRQPHPTHLTVDQAVKLAQRLQRRQQCCQQHDAFRECLGDSRHGN